MRRGHIVRLDGDLELLQVRVLIDKLLSLLCRPLLRQFFLISLSIKILLLNGQPLLYRRQRVLAILTLDLDYSLLLLGLVLLLFQLGLVVLLRFGAFVIIFKVLRLFREFVAIFLVHAVFLGLYRMLEFLALRSLLLKGPGLFKLLSRIVHLQLGDLLFNLHLLSFQGTDSRRKLAVAVGRHIALAVKLLSLAFELSDDVLVHLFNRFAQKVYLLN